MFAGQIPYVGSAYVGREESIELFGMTGQINEKGFKNHPLTDEQKMSNRLKSKTRARVEHVFGFITNSIDAMHVRTVAFFRVAAKIGLTNLTYNIMRCAQLKKTVYAVTLRE